MAPTEVLAEQHFVSIRGLLEVAGLSPPEDGAGRAPGDGEPVRDRRAGGADRFAHLVTGPDQLSTRVPPDPT